MATQGVNVEAIGSSFESLSGPRPTRDRTHRLVDIVVSAVCGMVCGCDGPTAIHRWAPERREGVGPFLGLPDGTPARDCLRRLIMALKPAAFPECFQEWITRAIEPDESRPDRLIAIDGKTDRRSHDRAADLGPLPIVTAWAREEGVALGQVATEARSHEITAVPLLLEQIDLTEALVTIDAMGCQKEIASDIVGGGWRFRDRAQGQPADPARGGRDVLRGTPRARSGRPEVSER